MGMYPVAAAPIHRERYWPHATGIKTFTLPVGYIQFKATLSIAGLQFRFRLCFQHGR
jgi:hypothetical protein